MGRMKKEEWVFILSLDQNSGAFPGAFVGCNMCILHFY